MSAQEQIGQAWSKEPILLAAQLDPATHAVVDEQGAEVAYQPVENGALIVDSLEPFQARTYQAVRRPAKASGSIAFAGDVLHNGKVFVRCDAAGFAGIRFGVKPWDGGSSWQGSAPDPITRDVSTGNIYGEVRYSYGLTIRIYSQADRVEIDWKPTTSELLRLELPRCLAHHRQSLYSSNSLNRIPLGQWGTIPLAEFADEQEIIRLSGWGAWFGNTEVTTQLMLADGSALKVGRLYPERWTQPIGVRKVADRAVLMLPGTGGEKAFYLSRGPFDPSLGWNPDGAQVVPYQRSFREIQAMALSWPKGVESPTAVLNQAEIEAARPTWLQTADLDTLRSDANRAYTGQPDFYQYASTALYLIEGADNHELETKLRGNLGLLGNFDKMRYTATVAAQYDAIIQSLPEADRELLRARMAYLAYVVMDPSTWDPSKGWASGNTNMTVSYRCQAPAWLSAVLPEHPMAAEWKALAVAELDGHLARVGSQGEWPESIGYANLSLEELLQAAILTGYVADERLVKAVECLLAWRTPRDPRHGGQRENIPYGRAAGTARSLDGALARLTSNGQLQTSWVDNTKLTVEFDLGGIEYAYLDPNGVMPEPVTRTSGAWPALGCIMRKGDSLMALVSGDHPSTIYGSQSGGIATLFYKGIPLAGAFVHRYLEGGAEALQSRVSPYRRPQDLIASDPTFWVHPDHATFERSNLTTFETLEGLEYAVVDLAPADPVVVNSPLPVGIEWPDDQHPEGQGTFVWRRQVLWIDEQHYLVADTVTGNEPTQWTFWSASDVDGLGQQNNPAKPTGSHEHDIACDGASLKLFVADPATPLHRLRWGADSSSIEWGLAQWQDGWLMAQPAGNHKYCVGLYPRLDTEPGAVYESIPNGVKVTRDVGTDYAVLSAADALVVAGDFEFEGTAGAALIRGSEVTLILAAAGRIAYQGYELVSATPARQTFSG